MMAVVKAQRAFVPKKVKSTKDANAPVAVDRPSPIKFSFLVFMVRLLKEQVNIAFYIIII